MYSLSVVVTAQIILLFNYLVLLYFLDIINLTYVLRSWKLFFILILLKKYEIVLIVLQQAVIVLLLVIIQYFALMVLKLLIHLGLGLLHIRLKSEIHQIIPMIGIFPERIIWKGA